MRKWAASLSIIIALLYFSVDLANAGLGCPSLHASAYVTPSEIERGSSGELIVTVSEVGGEDWAKDVTVTPSISPLDGCTISPSFKSTSGIGESSSTTFHFTIYASKDATLGRRCVHISVKYYETGWLDIGTFGPYYSSSSTKFSVKKGHGFISISSVPSGAKVYIDGVYKGTTPLFLSVEEGRHTIKLVKFGYAELTKTIYVYPGETTYVSETLSSTWLLTSIFGIIALISVFIVIFVISFVIRRRKKGEKLTATKAEEITEKEKTEEVKVPEPEEVRERLRKTYSEKDAARLANAFRIIQDIKGLYCNTNTKAGEISKELDLLKMYLTEKEFLDEVESIQRKINAELREEQRLSEKHVEEVKDFCEKFIEMWIARFLR